MNRDALEKMLAAGKDNALLRFSLGGICLKEDDAEAAAQHYARAVELDPGYSAAFKGYGQALAALGRMAEALDAYERGIAAAESRGDIQAAREMRVFAKRLQR